MEEFRRVSCAWNENLICRLIDPIFVFSEQQRAQRVFKAQQPLDLPAARNKLLGFGMQLLDGIDPNPDNMVCAGIIHTQGQQVGCLLRLEPNRQAQVSVNPKFFFDSLILNFRFDFVYPDVQTDDSFKQRSCYSRNG